MIKWLMDKYQKDDGRPWYKQIVSGLLLAVSWVLCLSILAGLMTCLHEAGVLLPLILIVVWIVVFNIGVEIYLWSVEDNG